jgi:hypothetical protein
MTSHEIAEALGTLIRSERRITNQILEMINLAYEKRAYLDLGFASMFEWLTKGFGYSNAAAYRRIEVAKLLKAIPEVSEKLASGQVNLSTLSKAQSMITSQEKAGQKISIEMKSEIVNRIENKTYQETEKTLIALFPESAPTVHQECRRVIDAETTRHSMNLSQQATLDLNRAKEVLSHKFPKASDADIIQYALKFLLDRVDPLRKVEKQSKSNSSANSKAAARRVIIKNANAQCTFKDPVTGRVCGSRHQVQMDHIIPKALGGTDDSVNLRPLCRQHNLLMAERVFGKSLINRYRRQ